MAWISCALLFAVMCFMKLSVVAFRGLRPHGSARLVWDAWQCRSLYRFVLFFPAYAAFYLDCRLDENASQLKTTLRCAEDPDEELEQMQDPQPPVVASSGELAMQKRQDSRSTTDTCQHNDLLGNAVEAPEEPAQRAGHANDPMSGHTFPDGAAPVLVGSLDSCSSRSTTDLHQVDFNEIYGVPAQTIGASSDAGAASRTSASFQGIVVPSP